MITKKTIKLKRSFYLALYGLAVWLFVMSLALLVAVPVFYQCLLLFYVSVMSFYYYQRFFAKLRITSICWQENDILLLKFANGSSAQAQLVYGTRVFAKLIILHMKVAGSMKKQKCYILSDSLDADTFRQLKVHLRYGLRSS